MSWKHYEFGKLATLSSEKYYPKNSEESFHCVELEHIEQISGRLLGTTNSSEQKSTKNVFKKGQILYGKLRPYLKKYYRAEFDGVCSTEIWVLSGNPRRITNDYLFFLVQSEKFNRFTNISSGTKMPRADWNLVSESVFGIPPINEQNKIANILSTWDKAIELKEKLIEEKKKQKKGLMRKLLTGEMILPDFDGDWKVVKIGSVLKERNETGFNDLELLSITSKNGVVRRTEVDIKDNSSNDKSKYKRICIDDIGYNTMRMWQGVSGVSNYEGIVSPAYTIIKPNGKVDSTYIGYLFKLPKVINAFWRYSQGLVSDTLNLKYANLKIIKIRIPCDVYEQKAIARILSTADKEIDLLEQELDALKLQKKGLLQLLLTGIVRVNIEQN